MDKKITASKVVLTSFLVDVSDIAINLLIAYFSGSVIMVSQALEGGADLLASSFLLVGVKRARKPRDKKHPFGHGRELYFWTFISALSTFAVTACVSFYLGLKRFLDPQEISNTAWAIAALTIAIATNAYSMSLSLKRLFIKNGIKNFWKVFTNSALIETKTTLILDTMGTIASILGLLGLFLFEITGNTKFDGMGAMGIGITLAVLAIIILKGAKDLLVGQSAPLEVEKKILKITERDPKVKKVLDLRTLQIGPNRLLINIEVHLADELSTDEIEILIDKIENKIKSEIPSASNINITLETPDVEKQHSSI